MQVQLARGMGSEDPMPRALPREAAVRGASGLRPLAFALCIGLALSGVVFLPKALGSRRAVVTRAATGLVTPAGTGIEALQARLRTVPSDARAWAALGAAYVQQARISGDPSWYPKAERSLDRSLAIQPRDNAAALTGLGALAAARHDFGSALRWGTKARAVDPYDAAAYGVIGDALIELGRYPEAFRALQRMVDLRPGLSSYARVSYAWELQGNISYARTSLEMALEAASTPSDAAFAAYYLGELEWNRGNIDGASAWYAQSEAHDATYVPAMQGLAKVDAARGRIRDAIARYELVVQRLPVPQYIAELADLYGRAGDAAGRQRTTDLLAVQEALFRANGVDIDLEQALFDADHGLHVSAGLRAARAEWKRRKSVFVADALAWALHANRRDREALAIIGRAFRLGTRTALFFFHRGMIERALGLGAAARGDIVAAMRLNPYFSFRWAPLVPAILRGLR